MFRRCEILLHQANFIQPIELAVDMSRALYNLSSLRTALRKFSACVTILTDPYFQLPSPKLAPLHAHSTPLLPT